MVSLDPAALLSLMRLSSPALPIGGFSYSQGLESAIDAGWVGTEAEVCDWIATLLHANIGRFDAPLCMALFRAVALDDDEHAARLHERWLASRETAELRAETLQMGQSLLQMLAGLELEPALAARVDSLRSAGECALPLAWGLAARAFGLEPLAALAAWCWAWLENQVMAAIKTVPLGQQAGQRLFSALRPALASVLERAADPAVLDLPTTWSNFAPGFAIASSRHETQYSRLFRS
jgi:urease accessory protein